MEKKKKNLIKFLNTGSTSSIYLNQTLIDTYPYDYNKNKLTQVSFNYKNIHVPLIDNIVKFKTNIYGYPFNYNSWSESTYHLNKNLKTKMIKLDKYKY